MKDIERNNRGVITKECMADMLASLPIKVYVNDDKDAHRVLKTEQELNRYFKGALPYVLTTRYEKI